MDEKRCSFCGKAADAANVLIQAPNGTTFICAECVRSSTTILSGADGATLIRASPKPSDPAAKDSSEQGE